ncbi:MAG: RNA-directed DNA polymerase [Bacteroidaceae bacterium]|nr:RNA-directed DNA polymerase [Bacteroidaceae bacterium]
MLDQSFSAHNFETIYNLESRKGNIDINTMPEEFRMVIARAEYIKKEIHSLRVKKDRSLKETELIEERKSELNDLTDLKKSILHNYLEKLDKQVHAPDFKFSLNKFMADDEKEVFTLNVASHVHLFAIKQLQYNICHTFKVKQANRHSILANIKNFLNSDIPVYIIRTDISRFYESIPHDKLMPMVLGNTLLSHKSKAFIKGIISEYEKVKDTTLVPTSHGIPRGIGISSYLSEMYMRNIDANIAGRTEVMFYARYVDDIFMILSTLPTGKNLEQYYADMTTFFQSYGLTLKQLDDGSGKCNILDFTTENNAEIIMNYLGYCLYMNRQGKRLTASFGLSDSKKDRYRTRIDNAIIHFKTMSKCNIKQAYRDLLDSLNMITGNFKLFKSKSSVKVGMYYSNDLLDRIEDLDELTLYLHGCSIEPYAGLMDCANIKSKLSKRIGKIDIKQRWEERKMYTFSLQRLQEMEKWL